MPMRKHAIRRILSAVYSTPWAITEEKFAEILLFLDRRAEGHLSDDEIALRLEEFSSRALTAEDITTVTPNNIAVIDVGGTITHRANFLTDYSGGTSTESLQGAFRSAINDPNISGIVLRVDSPGGTVPGVPELASEIYAARGKKPIKAFVSPMMASAAYWIGSAADEIIAMPSAEAIGSVGVRLVHVERSKADEKSGVTRTQIAVPSGKGAINDFTPLTDDSRAELMTKINAIYGRFSGDVARNRGVSQSQVEDKFGGGRTFLAEESLQRGMIDRIATWDEMLSELATSTTRPTSVAVGREIKPAFYRVSENVMNKLVMEAMVRRGLCSIDATEEVATVALNKFFADSGKAKPASDVECIVALMAPVISPTAEPVRIAEDTISLASAASMVSISPLSTGSKMALIGEFSKAGIVLTADHVADRINRMAAENNAPVGASVRVEVAEADKIRTDARDALLLRTWGGDLPQSIYSRQRGDVVAFAPQQGARAYNLGRLSSLARTCAIACGVPSIQVDALVPADLAQLALGALDVSRFGFLTGDVARNISGMYTNILMDATNVVLRRAYDDAPQTFSRWTRQGESLPDFKSKYLVSLSDLPDPRVIPENGEFEEVIASDARESYKLVNWGEVFSISWEAVVNDQLSAFTRIPQLQGAAMRRKQNRLVYAILLSNPTMADTGALFNATAITTAGGHANLTTGAGAPSVATLNTLTQKMMEQKGLDTTNGAILNIMPTYLIAPPALMGTVKELLTSTANPAASQSGVNNIWQGGLTPVIEGELSAAAGGSDVAWYLAASTSQVDTIEYAYLAGYETPRLDRMESFDRLGTKFRIYQPFAAKAIDYRGLQKHAGA